VLLLLLLAGPAGLIWGSRKTWAVIWGYQLPGVFQWPLDQLIGVYQTLLLLLLLTLCQLLLLGCQMLAGSLLLGIVG
jgi:hypothetical protein